MKDFKLAGLKLPVFVVVLILSIISIYTNTLPKGMVGAFFILLIFGELFNLIGNKTPIINTFFGGGAIVCIFGGAAIVYFKLVPEAIVKNTSTFMTTGGFLDFYIAALITGSILGMNRKLLIKACLRYLPCIIASVAVALLFVALGGVLFGMSFKETTAYIGIPIMGGGMGAGAVPISKVFAPTLGVDAKVILAKLVPAVALGNAMAIVAGGLLNRLGKSKPALTGNGNLVRNSQDDFSVEHTKEQKEIKITDYSAGIIVSTGFFAFGAVIAMIMKFIGVNIHTYAWMIITVAVCKMLDILPHNISNAAEHWYAFIAKNFTGALMLGIGVAYTDLGQIISAFSLQYVVLCALVVIGAIIGAGIVGHLVGFYFIESAITAGLCMANMGGTGDVAVLTASNRMELMPFAQISSRLGGAFIILIASFLVPIFFG